MDMNIQDGGMQNDFVLNKATVITNNTQDTKYFIGMNSNTFKARCRNHIKSFTDKKYSNETRLALKIKKNRFHQMKEKDNFIACLTKDRKSFQPANTKINFR